MLKRHLWLGVLGLLVAEAGWVYAQTQDFTFSLWDFKSSRPAEELDERIFGPEIWRLPPVGGGGSKTPPALVVPPMETLPTPPPDDKPPVSNAPASSSGVLPSEEHFEEVLDEDAEKLWDGSFDLGLDGSEGNSETFNFHFGFHAQRKTVGSILSLGLDYNKRTAKTIPTTNRLFFDGRLEWLIAESRRWSVFVHETIEYDEFQSFNVRDASDVGLGYRIIKNKTTTLIGRLGGGFSHEYGGPDNGLYVPEAVFGLQLERRISKRQKILWAVEYAPDVGNFLRYRIRTQAAWEMLLDEEKNLSLRMGVLDRYNSVPNGVRPNDLDYALMLMWKF